MKRAHLVVAVVATLGACLLVPFAGSAAGPPDVVCSQVTNSFTGTARDLTVPAGGFCAVSGATITRDLVLLDGAGAEVMQTSVGHDVRFGFEAGALILDSTVDHDIVAAGDGSGADVIESSVGHDMLALGEESGYTIAGTTVTHDVRLLGLGSGTHMERTTIGHDFVASTPQTVQTGRNGPNTPGGPVTVGHDFSIDGSPDFPFVFDGMCDLHVEHNLSITNRTVNLGIGLGSNCAGNGLPGNTIGRDLIFTGNHAVSGFFGPSSLRVVANQVGRDLVFANNTAVPGGALEVSRNVVGHDATCSGNNPAVTVNGPNSAGHSNTCG
jgi:hypothetical protein